MLMLLCLLVFFFLWYGDHLYLHVLTHSFPTRRSSVLLRRQDPVHVGRPDGLPDRLPRPERCRGPCRRPALAMLCELVRPHSRPHRGGTLFGGGRQATAEVGDPQPRSGRSKAHTSELQPSMRI